MFGSQDQQEGHKRLLMPLLFSALGGIGFALIIASVPSGYLETAVTSIGLSEIIPAAAPPLGNTARALVAIFAGLIVMAILMVLLSQKGKEDSDMGFEFPKISGLSKLKMPSFKFSRNNDDDDVHVTHLSDLPKWRDADDQDDMPKRQPIFAEQELGSPMMSIRAEEEPALDIAQFEEAEEPEVLSEEVLQPAVHAPAEAMVTSPVQTHVVAAEPIADKPAGSSDERDLSELNLHELVNRLESSLAGQQFVTVSAEAVDETPQDTVEESSNDSPVREDVAAQPASEQFVEQQPVPPVRPVTEVAPSPSAEADDRDDALKAALDTLQRMTAQGR